MSFLINLMYHIAVCSLSFFAILYYCEERFGKACFLLILNEIKRNARITYNNCEFLMPTPPIEFSAPPPASSEVGNNGKSE